MKRLVALIVVLIAVAIMVQLRRGGDETVSAYGATGMTWQLKQLNGTPFTARATLRFPEPGALAGEGPCNSFTAEQTAPYPWFELAGMSATEMACAELPQEQAYFAALARMGIAEVSGEVLILSTEAGEEMLFRAE